VRYGYWHGFFRSIFSPPLRFVLIRVSMKRICVRLSLENLDQMIQILMVYKSNNSMGLSGTSAKKNRILQRNSDNELRAYFGMRLHE